MLKNTKNPKRPSRALVIFTVSTTVLMVFIVVIILNFATIKDILVGMGYHPSKEMSEIRTSLELTDTGQRIFNAVMPELMEKDLFNTTCRDHESETAVLGCYKGDRVYVYNVAEDELLGIRELTSAHELLHAVYHRMPESERRALLDSLSQIYQENQDLLGEEIDLYEETQKAEELYVRIGTEIKNLPENLESHYATIFKNQDKIADFYNSYIAVFREIEKNLESLLEKAKATEAKINEKIATYEKDAESLNQEITEFNTCASTPNCFTSNWAFNNKRNQLLAKRNNLNQAYEEINQKITEYNQIVTEYNQNVLHGQALNLAINSATKVNQPE